MRQSCLEKGGLRIMKARKESDLKLSCDSQSNKRISSYRATLTHDTINDKPLFDDRQLALLEKYAKDDADVESVHYYLDHLKDPDGIRFGRSQKSYENMMTILEKFTLPEAKPFNWNRHFRRAVEKVTERYSAAKLSTQIPTSNQECVDMFTKLNTSAGYEWIISGTRHKGDFDVNKIYPVWRDRVKDALIDQSFNHYALLSTRTQCSGEFDVDGVATNTCKHKTRPVWMWSMFLVLTELMWANPMTRWLKFYKHSSAGKTDQYTWTRISALRRRYPCWLSLDYSSYDASIPSWLLHEAFSVLRAAFPNMTSWEVAVLKVVEEDFINKNVIVGDRVIHVSHGDPSGSALTTIINGICNEIITETWADWLGVEVNPTIQGDDNLIFSNKELPLEEISSYITYNFGVVVNAFKCSQGVSSSYPEYLSRVWTNAGPWRHPHELISKILYPEHFRDYSECSPELMLYSYVLGYRAGMEKLIDVPRFLSDISSQLRDLRLESPYLDNLPYNVRLAYQLTA
jgi:hypothetical protein